MSKFRQWLIRERFNVKSDVLVVGGNITVSPKADLKVILVKSFKGVAVIKSGGTFKTTTPTDFS